MLRKTALASACLLAACMLPDAGPEAGRAAPITYDPGQTCIKGPEIQALDAVYPAGCTEYDESCDKFERWKMRSSNFWTAGRYAGFMDDARLPNYSATGRNPAMWTPSQFPFIQVPLGWSNNDRDHKSAFNYAYRPKNPGGSPAHADTLILYLHGGSGASADSATELYRWAAEQGYFVVGLDWLNDASPAQLCTCNSACYDDLFAQLVVGSDRGFYKLFFGAGALHEGDRAYNSIQNRLLLLLKHMRNKDSGQWGTFLKTVDRELFVDWSKIVVAGHSDGSQVTAWIGQNKPVKRVIFFSGPKTQLSKSVTKQLNYDATPIPHHPDDYTSAPTECTPLEQPPAMYDGYPTRLARAFVSFWDDRYEQGVTADDSAYCSNGWEAWDGGSQSRLLDAIGMTERRITQGPPVSGFTCDPEAFGGTWLTVIDPHQHPHSSTVGDDEGWKPGFRECVWGWALRDLPASP